MNNSSLFPYPVHFKFSGRKSAWPEFYNGSPLPLADTIPNRIIEVEECWIAQTYLQLHQRKFSVTLSDCFQTGAINIVSYFDLAIRDLPFNYYIIAVQHDAPRPEICQKRIVQNPLNIKNTNDHYIPHWPQPGIIPRDSNRKSRIENLCFKGSEYNLYPSFRSPAFLSQLKALGVQLRYDVKEKAQFNWNDYSECDLILAVRDVTETDLQIKPASKLINAWLGKCPSLLGPEPAYQMLRRTPLDYFEVRTPEDVLNIIKQLKNEPNLYEEMIKNGQTRGEEFTPDRIADIWVEFLKGPASTGFNQWNNLSSLRKASIFLFKTFLHKYNSYIYLHRRDHGFRPISNRYT